MHDLLGSVSGGQNQCPRGVPEVPERLIIAIQ